MNFDDAVAAREDYLDRVIRGLDDATLCRYVQELVDIVFAGTRRPATIMDWRYVFRVTPKQKRAALARVFGVEDGG